MVDNGRPIAQPRVADTAAKLTSEPFKRPVSHKNKQPLTGLLNLRLAPVKWT